MDTPRIRSVKALPPTTLLVEFRNGQWRRYDIAPLLERPAFESLRNQALFASVFADMGGYGVIWNDEVDLAEYEIWHKGIPVPPPEPGLLMAAEPHTGD